MIQLGTNHIIDAVLPSLVPSFMFQGAPKDELENGLASIKALAGEWKLETKRVVRSKVS